MGPLRIIVLTPLLNTDSRLQSVPKPFQVEAFVAQLPVVEIFCSDVLNCT